MIRCVKQFVGALTERFSEILLVKSLHIRILMGFADRQASVLLIDCASSLCKNPARLRRISATSDTSALARHDLNELIWGGSRLDFIEHLSRIAQTMNDCDANLQSIEIDLRFTDSLCSTHLVKLETR